MTKELARVSAIIQNFKKNCSDQSHKTQNILSALAIIIDDDIKINSRKADPNFSSRKWYDLCDSEYDQLVAENEKLK